MRSPSLPVGPARLLAAVALPAALVIGACGGNQAGGTSGAAPKSEQKPATADKAVASGGSPSSNPPASPGPSTKTGAGPSPSPGSGGGRPIVLGGITFNDFGLADVRNQSQTAMRVDNFAFQPTFLRGEVRQGIKIQVTNQTSTLHNFTMAGGSQAKDRLDQDIPPGGQIEVEVSFPGQQAVRFFCKYHTGQGMNGELLAGNAEIQPVP